MDSDPLRLVLADVQKLLKAVYEVQASVAVVREKMETSDERVAELEKGQRALEKGQNDHETRLQLQEAGTRTTNNILRWMLGLLGTAVFMLLWAIFTGQVTLVFS